MAGAARPYQVRAAIAACHATAEVAAETDWKQIVGPYDQLLRMAASPVAALNRAVAVGMADGPAAGLALVDSLTTDGDLADYPLLAATQADLLRRLDRRAEAAVAYRDAIERASTDPERRYLTRRLADVTGSAGSTDLEALRSS